MKIRKKILIIFLLKIDLIIFEMKQPLLPLSAFKYEKRDTEKRVSETYNCPLYDTVHWLLADFYYEY